MRRSAAASVRTGAAVFAALADETRLQLIGRLAAGSPLRVLEGAGVVRASRSGRESLFTLDPRPIDDARDYLAQVSRHWDDALTRLKAMVERG